MSDTLVGTFTVSLQDNRILLPSHGLVDNDTIRFALGAVENVLPSPLSENVQYFVAESRGNDFRVSLTEFQFTVVNITDKGTGDNEVWEVGGHPIWQMSSTVTAELHPMDFWETKLIV